MPSYEASACERTGASRRAREQRRGTGSLPDFDLTTPTAPGVTHRWTRLQEYIDEPSNARIWSGIHYRFSTEVGTRMGRMIAEYTVQTYLQPLQ